MILVDTGPLVAVADADDTNHAACVSCLETAPGPLLVPCFVVPEVCHLLRRELGSAAEAAFLRAFPEDLALQDVTAHDLRRAADLVEQYADLPLGTVDATIVALAERLRLRTIVTLDRRHFSVVRPLHVPAFDLVP